jgi:anti-sigma factor RsiW
MDTHNDFLQDRINALVDGRLPPAAQADALASVAADPAALETLQAFQAQREALRNLHRGLLDEPVPETLLSAARRGQQGRQQVDQWWRWGGMAAGVVMAFAVGWFSHGRLGATGQAASQMASGALRPGQAFVQQASFAHAAFSPEVRHPVEVTAAQQDHLVQWLSKRLGKPLKVPVLAAEGYELVGGRLLPGDGGTGGVRAQFMFQNPAGLRVTLFLGALDGNKAAPMTAGASAASPSVTTPVLTARPDAAETSFRYSADGPVPSFYWAEQGFGYALSGAVSRDELMKLAQLVYQQL